MGVQEEGDVAGVLDFARFSIGTITKTDVEVLQCMCVGLQSA